MGFPNLPVTARYSSYVMELKAAAQQRFVCSPFDRLPISYVNDPPVYSTRSGSLAEASEVRHSDELVVARGGLATPGMEKAAPHPAPDQKGEAGLVLFELVNQ